MISGKLPNNTVWWLSKDGLKVWIESKDLELEKFIEKGFYIARDNIFRNKKYVGELTTSRLESRKYKDAWVIKLDAIVHVYPELIEEINRKELEDKKKKKVKTVLKGKRETKRYVADQWPKKEVTIDLKKFLESKKEVNLPNIDIKNEITAESIKEINLPNIDIKNEITAESIKEINLPNIDIKNDLPTIKNDLPNIDIKNEITEIKKEKEPIKDYFDISRQYVSWIKDEVEKNNGKMIISTKDLKTKMGEEYLNMHDIRIYFGLKKLLSKIGIIVESGNIKGENMMVMTKDVKGGEKID